MEAEKALGIPSGWQSGIENSIEEMKSYNGLNKLMINSPIIYEEYLVFGFLFAETKEENISELERILKSDLKEFVTSE